MSGHVLPLAQAVDPMSAGGKAAALAVLMRAGLSVPDGFVLTASTRAVLVRTLSGRASAAWDEAKYLRVLRQAVWPDDLARDLAAALRDLVGAGALADAPVAVRSSGIAEDGAVHSFAGQFTTVLDVCGIEAVRDAVLRCWAGGRSERVRRYAGRRGSVDLAVLVQRMVPARWSGVLFSSDPFGAGVGGRVGGYVGGSMVVEAVSGLPDKLCDGSADPVRFEVDRTSMMPTAVAGEASGPPLELIREVGRTALAAEHALGRPVDMEWCAVADGGPVHVLQARPITRSASAPPSMADMLVNLS